MDLQTLQISCLYYFRGLFYNRIRDEVPQVFDTIEWFPEDFEIKKKSHGKLLEQCCKVRQPGYSAVFGLISLKFQKYLSNQNLNKIK